MSVNSVTPGDSPGGALLGGWVWSVSTASSWLAGDAAQALAVQGAPAWWNHEDWAHERAHGAVWWCVCPAGRVWTAGVVRGTIQVTPDVPVPTPEGNLTPTPPPATRGAFSARSNSDAHLSIPLEVIFNSSPDSSANVFPILLTLNSSI